MRLIVTGTPGTGKTLVARELAKRLKLKYVNEKALARAQGSCCGEWDSREKEWVVPVQRLTEALKKAFRRHPHMVAEGHLLCETRVPADRVIVLRTPLKELEKRLEKRKYSPVKVLDNVFAEQEAYCLKAAQRTFGRSKVWVRVNKNKIGIKGFTANLISDLLREMRR